MPIIRVSKNKENPFVMLDKRPLNDASLSWGAKGMLAYLLSKPDNWQVNMKHLVGESTNGRDATYTIMRELIGARYCTRVTMRDEAGRVTKTEYVVSEHPLPENPDTDNPDTENPYVNNTDSNENESNNIFDEEETPPEKIETQNVFKVYERNIGVLTPMIAEELAAYEKELSLSWVLDALKIAVDNNARSWAYARAILDKWRTHGYGYDDRPRRAASHDAQAKQEAYNKFISEEG